MEQDAIHIFNPNIEIEYRFFSDFILNLCWILLKLVNIY